MPATRSKILLLGDSLTQIAFDGWAGQLAHVYQRRADVINRGMSGYNTKWYLEYAKDSDVWTQENVKLVIIFFGANDASDEKLNPRHHVPLDDFKQNLETMIGLCEDNYGKDVAIVVISAPPVVHEQRFVWQKERWGDKATGLLERNMEISQLYAKAALDVAAKHGRPCVHLWELMQEEENWESFFYDGLHFARPGHDFVAKAILKTVYAQYPKLEVKPCSITQQWGNSGSRCEDVMHDGPYHDQIDHLNHEQAFVAYKKQKLEL